MKKLSLLIFIITFTLGLYAKDNVPFVADAPDVVVSGDQFRLTYTINTQDVKDFLAPMVDGFDVLMGPSRSQQSSTQIINGKMTSSRSLTYTYILMAREEGNFTIPSASIEVDGKKIFSNTLTIKVLPQEQSDDNAARNENRSQQSSRRNVVGEKISDKDLFITATASKTKVHEQEAILLTYKVYTQVNLRQLYGKMPDLKGFHTQEVSLPQQKTFSLEHYKGRNYNTTVWSQYVLFPQQTGKMEIPSITFEGVVAQRTMSDDPFEAFFNGGGYIEVKKKIVTPKLKINVEPLPGRPIGFSGAVGAFDMKSSISATDIKVNEAVTIKLTISGVGNMKLIGIPNVKFHQDFEVYDPKINDKYELTTNGLSGSKTFEYLAIPRTAGSFTIPSVEFIYFDLQSNSYKTLKTEEYHLNVAKGKGGNNSQVITDFTNKENVKVIGKDIRFIKIGKNELKKKNDFFFGTTLYYMWYIVPFVLFVLFIVVYRKQAIENANIAKVKHKKANKVATKRMKIAGKLLAQNKQQEFYDEVLKALWGYISDKLSIPVSQLSKDNIESKLSQYGVGEELTKEFIDVLNECEFARYAPGNDDKAMDKIYSICIEVISKMEDSLKH